MITVKNLPKEKSEEFRFQLYAIVEFEAARIFCK